MDQKSRLDNKIWRFTPQFICTTLPRDATPITRRGSTEHTARPWRNCAVTVGKIDVFGFFDGNAIADDETERLYTYRLFADWKASPNWQQSEPFSGVSIILANYVPGRREEYQAYYENVHSVEVINVPGHVAMKRGELSPIQIEPRRFCPGDQLVMCAQQTDDLPFTLRDFSARAGGRSPSGIAMQPRSSSASIARTVHYFSKVSGSRFWSGGIAYAGDLSVYPDKG